MLTITFSPFHFLCAQLQEPTLEQLREAGGALALHNEEHVLLDDFFYISGEIPRVTR